MRRMRMKSMASDLINTMLSHTQKYIVIFFHPHPTNLHENTAGDRGLDCAREVFAGFGRVERADI